MTELKTLKDIVDKEHYCKVHAKLKAEAIKWMKYMLKLESQKDHNSESLMDYVHKFEMWMNFFNLTEEDLK